MKEQNTSDKNLQALYEIGVALSAEQNIDTLLEKIVTVARKTTRAEGCTFYLCNENRSHLDFAVFQNERFNLDDIEVGSECGWPSLPLFLEDGSENHLNASVHCALTGQSINIHDVYNEQGYNFSNTLHFDQKIPGYRSKSMLLVPLHDLQGELIGVLQLINCREKDNDTICPFPQEAVEMITNLASQASIALVNARLIVRFEKLTSLGVALSAEKNLKTLLEMIADTARKFTHAEGCTVYLCNKEKKNLEFAVIQNEKLDINLVLENKKGSWPPIPLYDENGKENHVNVSAHCALTCKTINISEVYNEKGFDFKGTREYDAVTGYRTQSMLVIPMTDHEDEIIGVLQLINARKGVSGKICDFIIEDIQVVRGLASLAAVAVRNVLLIQGTENLLKSFVKCIAVAIDEKSSYTAGHVQRVAELTELIVRKINETKTGPFADIHFDDEQIEEVIMAAWMHDVGKIAIPQYVADKATKLETIFDRIELIAHRIEIIRRDREILHLKQLLASNGVTDADQTSPQQDDDLTLMYRFLEKSNIGREYMPDDDIAEIEQIGNISLEVNGVRKKLLNEEDITCFSIRTGTLTDKEKEIIKHHVDVSIKMLESLPFLKKWQHVPQIAGMHHEKLNGSGYPNGLDGTRISFPARILAVADIFEALTAADRPYKKGKTLSEVSEILEMMVKDLLLDESLCDFLIHSGIVSEYAEKYLAEKQKDTFCWKGQKVEIKKN